MRRKAHERSGSTPGWKQQVGRALVAPCHCHLLSSSPSGQGLSLEPRVRVADSASSRLGVAGQARGRDRTGGPSLARGSWWRDDRAVEAERTTGLCFCLHSLFVNRGCTPNSPAKVLKRPTASCTCASAGWAGTGPLSVSGQHCGSASGVNDFQVHNIMPDQRDCADDRLLQTS